MIVTVIDTETTGLDPFYDGVIEVAAVKVNTDTGNILESLCYRWSPQMLNLRPSSDLLRNPVLKANIDRCHREQNMLPQDCLTLLDDLIEGSHVASYGVDFDQPMLRALALRMYQSPPSWLTSGWLDVMTWARHEGFPDSKSNKLSVVAERLGITLEDAHTALADATATARILTQLFKTNFGAAPHRMRLHWFDLIRQTKMLATRQEWLKLTEELLPWPD